MPNVYIQNFPLFPKRDIPIYSLNKNLFTTQLFHCSTRSTIVIANYTRCNQTLHVELNNDIKALYARVALISKMTRTDRNEDGAVAWSATRLIFSMCMYSRCRVFIRGNLDQITAMSYRLFPTAGIVPEMKLALCHAQRAE